MDDRLSDISPLSRSAQPIYHTPVLYRIRRPSPKVRYTDWVHRSDCSGNGTDLQNILILTTDLASRRRPFYKVKRRKLFSLRCLDVIQIMWRSVCADLSRLVRTRKKEEAVDRAFDRHSRIYTFLDVIHAVAYSVVRRWPVSAQLFNELFRILVCRHQRPNFPYRTGHHHVRAIVVVSTISGAHGGGGG